MDIPRVPELIWHDAVYALRMMRAKPAFAATAILTLALAIGGNTAMFTVIHAVLLKPLPFPDSGRLVNIPGGTPMRFREMRVSAQSFTGIAAFTIEETPTLSSGGQPVVVKSVRVSANFLQILEVQPLLGRSFRGVEDTAGGPPVAMLSFELWERRFAADPQILGKTATLGGIPYTVIGVLPPHFAFPYPDAEVWMTAPTELPLMPAGSRALSPFLNIFGRLKPGVSLEQATAEAKVIHRQYARAHPAMLDAKPKRPVTVKPMKEGVVAGVRSTLWLLLGAVGFVLLTACANVASLLSARAASRSREMAVRVAVGAGRLRLMGQLLCESLLLSLPGGVLGVLLAVWSLRAIPGITALELPRAQEIHFDWAVCGFAAALSIGTGLLFGLAPVLSTFRLDPAHALRASGEAASQGTPRRILGGMNLRGLLLIAQVALSIVLLVGTALLIQSVSRLRGVAIGFNPAHLLTAKILRTFPHDDMNQRAALFFQALVQRVQSVPGVRNATAAMFLPMMGYAGTPVQDAARPLLKLNERPLATISVIMPGYFRTLQIPFRRGRDFTERDKDGAERVAIIDEALARRFWPAYPRGLDPVGHYLWVGGVNAKPAQIIGIVADIHQNLENSAWPETVYVAFAQNPQPFATLAVRTEGDPLVFANAVRKHVEMLDKNQAMSGVQTMDDLVDAQVGERRLLAILLGSFATMALILALMGIYGVIAYWVAQRTREMGIRRALGAQHNDILRLIIGQSLRLTLVGAAIGVAGAFGLTRLMQSLLFHISATDPATFIAVVLLFLCVALAASYLPARRAARIDPMAALRM